jgi:hypothetical protein
VVGCYEVQPLETMLDSFGPSDTLMNHAAYVATLREAKPESTTSSVVDGAHTVVKAPHETGLHGYERSGAACLFETLESPRICAQLVRLQ